LSDQGFTILGKSSASALIKKREKTRGETTINNRNNGLRGNTEC